MVRGGRAGHPGTVPVSAAPPPSSDLLAARAGLRAWIPVGRELREADWQWRHRTVCWVLAAHLPVLAVLALAGGDSAVHVVVEAGALLALLGLALVPAPRRARSLAAALGLLACSAMLVHVFDGAAEAHFHYFVAVALIALYQEWAVYALAIGFVLLQHGVMGALGPGVVYDRAGDSWMWAAVHTAFVVAESAVLVIFWHANEASLANEDRLRAALYEGTGSLEARLQEADRMRADLIGTVSHEFRTPLTGIRGAALTLLKRGDRLDDAARARLLHAVLDQQQRLSRLLENMLVASRATAPDPTAVAELDAVAAEVAMLAVAARPEAGPVQVVVDPGTLARIDRQALHQVLANLVDNAQQHGARGAVPIVAGGQDAQGVWLTVSNEGSSVDLAAAKARLFQPFTQADGGATRDREGIGMGLYVVQRLVEVHGGSLDVRSEDSWVTVEVRLLPVVERSAALSA